MNRASKFIIVLSLLCMLPLNGMFAEDYQKKNEIQFKLGMFPAIEHGLSYFIWITDVFITALSGEDSSLYRIIDTIPSFSVEYLRNITNRQAIGTTVTVGVPFYGRFTNIPDTDLLLWYISITFKYRITYWQNSRVRLYGATALGCELFFIGDTSDPTNSRMPVISLQEVGFGVQFGNGTVFGTAEIGAGTEGSILILGAGFKF